MRGDNGAAVWWLAPHRPAGPGGGGREVEGSGRGGRRERRNNTDEERNKSRGEEDGYRLMEKEQKE